MPTGGPYQYVNITADTLHLPRHDQNGIRFVRPGEGFNGPAYYERFVSKGMLARISADTVTVIQVVTPADLISSTSIGVFNGSHHELPPHRFQRKASQTPPYTGSLVDTCEGRPKVKMTFSINAKPDDTMMVLYYFYTSSINPSIATVEIQRPETVSANWQYPNWSPLPDNYYSLSPQEQYKAIISKIP